MVNFYSFCISTPPRFAAAGLPAHTGFGIQQCPFLVEERSAKAFLGPPGCFRLARPAAPFGMSSALHHTTTPAGTDRLQTTTTNVTIREEEVEERTAFLYCLLKIFQ